MSDKAQPSAAAIAVASGILGLIAGYFLGQGSSIGLFDSSGNPNQVKKSWPNSYDVKVHADSSDEAEQADDEEDEDENDGMELKAFNDSNEEVKLVLGVRTDLGMGKGVTSGPRVVHQLTCSQEKSQPNALTLLSHATSTSSATYRQHHF